MSAPQSTGAEERLNNEDNPAAEDKSIESGEGATNSSSSGAESGSAPPSTPVKEAAAPPLTPSQPAPFVYDPNKITLKFIFANRDGIHVIVDFKPTDTIGVVKGALLSMWPDELPDCSGGDKIRLVCMGKGMLSPDTKSISSLDVPVFKTHATPVNVAVKPEYIDTPGKHSSPKKSSPRVPGGGGHNPDRAGTGGADAGSSGCSCVIS